MTEQLNQNNQNTQANDSAASLANMERARQQFIADVLTPKPKHIYRLDDYKTIRGDLFGNVKDAVSRRFPLYNDKYSMGLEDVDYDDPEDFDVDEQKRALLSGKSMTRRLRGRWVLRDANGKVVSQTRRMTLMHVPFMTDRGTFIRNGSEYAFTNIMRLEPGVYTKRKNDEISAQFNIKQGTGPGFNMSLNPTTGIFQIKRGTANAPAYTVFRDLGVTDEQMQKAWGDELFQKNKQAGISDKARSAASRIYNM
jgi:DNA-directed RNA polymerase beta subunit